MGTWNYKKALFLSFGVIVLLFFFGQNFELVPKNRLMFPSPQDTTEYLLHGGGDRIPTPRSNIIERYLLAHSPDYGAADMSYDGMTQKSFNSGIKNFLSDSEFRNSEAGKMIQEFEAITQARFVFSGSNRGNRSPSSVNNEESELAFFANKEKATLILKSKKSETSCGYSMQTQTFGLNYNSSHNLFSSVGMDFDPKANSSSVRMQWNW